MRLVTLAFSTPYKSDYLFTYLLISVCADTKLNECYVYAYKQHWSVNVL